MKIAIGIVLIVVSFFVLIRNPDQSMMDAVRNRHRRNAAKAEEAPREQPAEPQDTQPAEPQPAQPADSQDTQTDA